MSGTDCANNPLDLVANAIAEDGQGRVQPVVNLKRPGAGGLELATKVSRRGDCLRLAGQVRISLARRRKAVGRVEILNTAVSLGVEWQSPELKLTVDDSV